MDLEDDMSQPFKQPSESLPADIPPSVPTRLHNLGQDEASYDDAEIEADDEVSQQMTASYSEISFKSGLSPEESDALPMLVDPLRPLVDEILQRPVTLSCDRGAQPGVAKEFPPLNLEGTVHVEGNMTHFVTEDLEYKIKQSTPIAKKGDTPPLPGNSKSGTPNTLYRQLLMPQVGVVDPRLINDLESDAHFMASSIDTLTENLCGILHSISSITADNVDIYKDAVSKMSDAMDGNIKSMYTMMAKAEEVTQAMKSVQNHATRIKEIKRLVDLFESYV